MNEWNPIEVTPPNTFVRVKDKDGVEANAEPTYYPFEVVKMPGDERKPWGWRGTPVFYEDGKEHWDGGWMIDASQDLGVSKIGKITHWKLITE